MNRSLGLFLVLVGLLGCGGEPEGPGQLVLAQIDGEPVRLAEFETYLSTYLIDPETTGGTPAEADEVKSRLFDAFIEERMLGDEAERRGIEVEPWEIDSYLAIDEPENPVDPEAVATVDQSPQAEPPADDAENDLALRRELARQRLMVQKLLEEVTAGVALPGEAEILAHAEEHRERLTPERRLEIRALAFESKDEAAKVHREIRRRRMTFNEAVVRYEKYPGQGRPQLVDWSSLSEEMRLALEDLKKGKVSPPLEFHGDFYLFEIGSWLREPEDLALELQERARRELSSAARQSAIDDLLRETSRRARVKLKRNRLPFTYLAAGE